jgi:glycine dehydrogenase
VESSNHKLSTDKVSDHSFVARHVGPSEAEVAAMLQRIGYKSLSEFISASIPKNILRQQEFSLSAFNSSLSEETATQKLDAYMSLNQSKRSLIGLGYYGCITPTVIRRNILENPGWYTQYTPYQPEISQGRLEALLNFQTMICDLTGLDIANASMLDEATAAAEALNLCLNVNKKNKDIKDARFILASDCFPQTLSVVKTRAKLLGIKIDIEHPTKIKFTDDVVAVLLQYPNAFGAVEDYRELISQAKANGVMVVLACDLLSLALLASPGKLGADVAVGNAQRFGVPLGFGGPHAAFFATRDEFKRLMPGRLVGVSKDTKGRKALRLALQTREQHIRREKATSNICTAQVLLAVMSSMYAVYHGPEGIKRIAQSVNALTAMLAFGLEKLGFKHDNASFFDTLTIQVDNLQRTKLIAEAESVGFNFRIIDETRIGISLDEQSSKSEVKNVLEIFAKVAKKPALSDSDLKLSPSIPKELEREESFLQHKVFNSYHSETEFLRYVRRLESKDFSLTTGMIPLGSCTMKLNASSEMYPVSWKSVADIHPFVPLSQVKGYIALFNDLESALSEITGFDGVSLQPNAGSQGEFAGLLAIRGFLDSKGETQRNICLIPKSAHGTNPASAVMAGMLVVTVECDSAGNIDVADLQSKVALHKSNLACFMVTYPSTHGVFEETIKDVTQIIHDAGGQVYMDGANLNALVGLVSPAEIGADVCHINLHKTFCIPHGGGGPGMGPIAAKKHLLDFMPSHPLTTTGGSNSLGPVSAAPWGSASILVIPWMYMAMMGSYGLKRATEVALLNANYVAKRLSDYFPVLYRGQSNLVAHECILDLREYKKSAGIEVEDVAKRLMDYGFHAPTVSFPVPGTLMVEPTESESKYELDRFCDAMICIWNEIKAIEKGELDKNDNPLKNAPHPAQDVCCDDWLRPYSREKAAYPIESLKNFKFWPSVSRIDGVYGDRNLFCSCG